MGLDVETADPEARVDQDPKAWRADPALRDRPISKASVAPEDRISGAHRERLAKTVEGLRMLTIIQAQTPEQIQQFQELVAEYKAWDVQMLRSMGLDADTLLEYDYKGTVRQLVAEFSPPDGRLLLANFEGQLAGCAALRRLSPEIGEMKRVYVRREFRGRGFGKALIEAIVAAARQTGYGRLRLETASFMKDAQALYQSLGFYPIEPYREIPDELKHMGVFMELNLKISTLTLV